MSSFLNFGFLGHFSNGFLIRGKKKTESHLVELVHFTCFSVLRLHLRSKMCLTDTRRLSPLCGQKLRVVVSLNRRSKRNPIRLKKSDDVKIIVGKGLPGFASIPTFVFELSQIFERRS